MAVSDSDISAFVNANLGDPTAIANAAQQYGVSAADIERATGYTGQQIGDYFTTANINPWESAGASWGSSSPTVGGATGALSQTSGLPSGVVQNTQNSIVGGSDVLSNTIASNPFSSIVGPLSPTQQYEKDLYDQTGALKTGLSNVLSDNTISKEEAAQIKEYSDKYSFTAQDISKVTGVPIDKVQEVISSPEKYAEQAYNESLTSQIQPLKTGIDRIFGDKNVSLEEAAEVKAYSDQYGFKAEDISRVTGVPLADVQKILAAPQEYATKAYEGSILNDKSDMGSSIVDIYKDGQISFDEAKLVKNYLANTGYKTDDITRLTGIPKETLDELTGAYDKNLANILKVPENNLFAAISIKNQEGLSTADIARLSGGRFSETELNDVDKPFTAYMNAVEGKGDFSDNMLEFATYVRSDPKLKEQFAPQLAAIDEAKGIIDKRALNTDFGGEYKDYAMQMFLGLDNKTKSQAPEQLEFTERKTDTATGVDEYGNVYEYERELSPSTVKNDGVEPVYEYNYGDDGGGSRLTGYRVKVDSDAFGDGQNALYATYDTDGNRTGYESGATVHTSKRGYYGAKWDADGSPTPYGAVKDRSGLGGFVDSTIGGVKDMVGPEIWTLLKIAPPTAPYANAADAVYYASHGEMGNAAMSGLQAYAAYEVNNASSMQDPSSVNAVSGADLASDVATTGSSAYTKAMTNATIANMAAASIPAFKAAEDGNYTQLGALAAGAISNPLIADKFDFKTNPTVATAMNGISAYSAYQNNDLAGMLGAASGLMKSPDLRLASIATRFVEAARSGNSEAVINTANALGRELGSNERTSAYAKEAENYIKGLIPEEAKNFVNDVKKEAEGVKTEVEGVKSDAKDLFDTTKTDVKTAIDSLKTSTSDAAKVFQDSIRAGATEEEAYNAAKLYEGKILWDSKAGSAITPSGPSANIVGVDLTDISSGIQVAGPGGLDQGGFKPGTPTQTATGMFFTTPDGKTYPVTVNKETGMMTSTDPVGAEAVKQFRINDTSGIKEIFFDKTPIDPELSTFEKEALEKVTGKSSGDITDVEAKNASPEVQQQAEELRSSLLEKIKSGASVGDMLRMIGGLDTAENATALYLAKQMPELQAIMTQAQNSGYARELEDHLATDPTNADWLQEYKGITGKDYTIPDMGEIFVTGSRITDDGATEDAGDVVGTYTDPFTGISVTAQVDAKTGAKTETSVDPKNQIFTQVITTPNTVVQVVTDVKTNTQTKITTDLKTNTSSTVKVDTSTGVVTVVPSVTKPIGGDTVVTNTDTNASGVTGGTSSTSETAATTESEEEKKKKAAAVASAMPAGKPFTPPEGYIPAALKEQFLKTRGTQEAFKNPLADLFKIYGGGVAAQGMNNIDPQLASLLSQRMGVPQESGINQMGGGIPAGQLGSPLSQTTGTPYSESKSYFTYGQEDDIDELLGRPKRPVADPAGLKMADGGYVQPLALAPGGLTAPLMAASGGLPSKTQGREDFRHSKHVAGEGDGHSDDIPAMLADGEFVFSADVVSALGNGSTKAGSDKLYKMVEEIRKRARSTSPDKLAPPALKSPLDYLKKR